MNRRAQAGAAAAIVCAALLAASGGVLLASAASRGPSGSARATISSVRSASRRLDQVEAVQTAYGLTAGIATDLLALEALHGAGNTALDVLRPAAATTARMLTRGQIVDTLAMIQPQLTDAAAKLVAPEGLRASVTAVGAPLAPDTERALRTGATTLDAAPYASTLQWMQGEVARGHDETAQARRQISDAKLPSGGSRNLLVTVLGCVLVLSGVAFAVVVVAGVSRTHELSRRAFSDVLTRTANRRQLEDDLDVLGRDGDGHVAVLMVDIDHFKRLNDTAGHASGDRALARVAGIVSACLRRGDTVYRYGGEEFCVLLPNSTDEAAAAVADRIRAAVEAIPVEGEEHLPGERLTVSIGVATRPSPRDGIVAADGALYEAKRSGRNRVVAACA